MSEQKHILVIRLSAMGDVAMSVPVLRTVVEQNPNCKITVVSKPFFKPMFQALSNVSFYEVDVKKRHKGVFGLYQLFKELRKLQITHVADLHNVLRSKILRFFFTITGYKIAFIDKGRSEKRALTREKNKVFKQLKTTHQRYADVFSALGFKADLNQYRPKQKENLSSSVKKLVGKKENTWIGVAPFAAFSSKMYPLDLMKKVIHKLGKENVTIFLFGGGTSEIKELSAIEKIEKNAISVAGKLSFEEELNLIENLDIMLSMDSGNAHLAAMKNIKTITLWGVTHPFAGFAPFLQPTDFALLPDIKKYPKIPCSIYGNKIAFGYEDVMSSISPDKVVEKVLKESIKKESS